jgi:hypothetical protein
MSRAADAGGTGLRDWLIRFLFASTAIQSFDGLVQRAARYQQFGIDGMAATWLPRLWAATIDVIWYAGLLGIQRYGGRDWLSWVAFVVAFAASFGFQVFGAKDVPVAAVPPVALLLVLIVMHAPRRPQADAEPEASVGAAPPTRSAGTAHAAATAAAGRRASENIPAPTPALDRRALPARPPVPVGAHPAARERPADSGSPTVPAVPAREARAGTAPADPDRVMRAYWAAERSRGRTPSGADLDRVVGRNPDNGTGRKARSRYLREEADGRFTASTSSVPGPGPGAVPRLGGPVTVGTTQEREGTGNGATSFPTGTGKASTAAPASTVAVNGGLARPVVPARLDRFPTRQDRERSDA